MKNIVDYLIILFFFYNKGLNSDIWVMIWESNGMWEKIKCCLEFVYN